MCPACVAESAEMGVARADRLVHAVAGWVDVTPPEPLPLNGSVGHRGRRSAGVADPIEINAVR